jgi:sulfonate transport system permease protein
MKAAPTRAPGASYGDSVRTRFHPARIAIGALVLLVLWEVVSLTVTRGLEHPEYVMPDLGYVFSVSLPEISQYYSGAFGGLAPSQGGEQSVALAAGALLEHSAISLVRVVAGLAIGTIVGVSLGLAMSLWRPVRESGFGVANLLRMLPLLAMGPLFTLWFGPTTLASVVFVAFASALVMLVGTLVAVANVDRDQVHYARTLGISPSTVYRRVVLPAAIPELGTSLLVATVLAWSVVLASELYGIQDGVGWMMGQALKFTQVGRVIVIAGVFIVLTFLCIQGVRLLTRRLTRWAA